MVSVRVKVMVSINNNNSCVGELSISFLFYGSWQRRLPHCSQHSGILTEYESKRHACNRHRQKSIDSASSVVARLIYI